MNIRRIYSPCRRQAWRANDVLGSDKEQTTPTRVRPVSDTTATVDVHMLITLMRYTNCVFAFWSLLY